MDEIVSVNSQPIIETTTTDISVPRQSSTELQKDDIYFFATIKLEKDITASYEIKVKSLNHTENGMIIFGDIVDGSAFATNNSSSEIVFENKKYTAFTFMAGEVYDKTGRIGNRHVMIQLTNAKDNEIPLPPKAVVPEIVQK